MFKAHPKRASSISSVCESQPNPISDDLKTFKMNYYLLKNSPQNKLLSKFFA